MKAGLASDLGPDQAAEGLDPLDLEAQALRQVAAQAGQLDGVAQRHDAADLGRPVDVREVADRALQFGQQIVEHRPHRLEHGLGVLGGGGVALQVLGLGEGELQLLGQGLGEVAAAQRHAPLPDAVAVGDHQVGGVGAQRDDHHRLGRVLRIVFLGRRQVAQLVEEHEVVQRQRRELHDVDLDARLLEGLQGAEHGVALHGEQADLGLQGEALFLAAAAHPLVVPDHVVQVEGDLLPGLVADDVGDLLGLDRRQLDEPRQARSARKPKSPRGRRAPSCARGTASGRRRSTRPDRRRAG